MHARRHAQLSGFNNYHFPQFIKQYLLDLNYLPRPYLPLISMLSRVRLKAPARDTYRQDIFTGT